MIRRSHSSSPARRGGATAVEVAVLLIPFFLFLFGTFEYCRYLLVLHTATNAAREGARYASVNVTNPAVTGTQDASAPYSGAAPHSMWPRSEPG